MIVIEGTVPDAISAYHPGTLRDRLAAFGGDVRGLWTPNPGSTLVSGTIRGDAIGDYRPALGRRDAFGRRATGRGNGAIYKAMGGLLALDATSACPSVIATPVNRLSFGIGMLYYFGPGSLAQTRTHMGNAESGGSTVAHALTRAVGSSMDSILAWGGIRSTWIPNQPVDVQNRTKITAEGWYCIAVDRHQDQSGLSIDERLPVVAPDTSTAPSLTATFFGNNVVAGANIGTVGVAAMIVCDGPLVQNTARLAQWRSICRDLRRDLAG